MEKEYRLDTDEGERSLTQLFDGRSQLLVYHFMFGPSYEAGCRYPFDGRRLRRSRAAPSRPRSDPDARFARAAGEASGVQAADGWSVPGRRRRTATSTSTSGLLRPRTRCASRCRDRGREVDLAEALEGLPPIAHQNAAACGTDVLSYICESPMVSAFALEDGAVYQTYTTTWRGLEFITRLLPNPRPRAEGTRRGRRRLADLDSPPRRVRAVLTTVGRGTESAKLAIPTAAGTARGQQSDSWPDRRARHYR